jgi:hypothetical protein
MKRIYKYKFQNRIVLPIGAQVLTVQLQDREPYLWALVDPFNQDETRNFEIFGTGWDLKGDSNNGKYIATFQQDSLVWHVFELIQ